MNIELMRKRCDAVLLALVGSTELAERWWISYNKAFNQSPEKEFENNPNEVYNYLMRHAHGEW